MPHRDRADLGSAGIYSLPINDAVVDRIRDLAIEIWWTAGIKASDIPVGFADLFIWNDKLPRPLILASLWARGERRIGDGFRSGRVPMFRSAILCIFRAIRKSALLLADVNGGEICQRATMVPIIKRCGKTFRTKPISWKTWISTCAY